MAVLRDCGMSGGRFGEFPFVAAGCRGAPGSRDGSADQAFCLAVHCVVGAGVALRAGLRLAQPVGGGGPAELAEHGGPESSKSAIPTPAPSCQKLGRVGSRWPTTMP